MTKTIENFHFKTEVSDLLHLVIHSLYSHRDIFLRELISNASDALDKLRFESLQDASLLGDNTDLKIKLIRDDKKNTLTISDNGIGMTHQNLIDHLGTIARSGTKEFMKKIQEAKGNMELIGQFGVGFYAAFMAADTVEVITKTNAGDAYRWVSKGEAGFEIEPTTKEARGTDVILHLKNDCKEYLEEYRIREIVRKYSDFVEHPILMDIEREEKPTDKDGKELKDAQPEKKIIEETLNSRKALWARSKSEIKAEEYIDFYKHISHDYHDPLETIHFSAEGKQEFKALLYLPSKAPHDLFMKDSVKGLHLYIKRVFIMNDCKKLIPEYLRFVRGVVDSSDLPLNVSREILQEDSQLDKIKANLVKKILSTLKTLKEKEFEKYLGFYKEFGQVLKEGLHYDWENKEAITDLLLFETTKSAGTLKPLQDYVNAMPKEQKDIYYIIGEDRKTLLTSPHLEAFKAKDLEVLLMSDPVDEWIVPNIGEYQKKQLKAIDKGDVELIDKKEKEALDKKAQEQFGTLVSFMKEKLTEQVKDVRFSQRLTDSPACLVAENGAMSEQMARMFKAMGQEMPVEKRILELNPNHPLIAGLQKLYTANKENPDLADYASLVYDQALLLEGSKLADPLAFAQKLSKLMLKGI